jgi:actin-related protein 8
MAMAGLQRTDNNLDFSNWPLAQMINQKNYYTYVPSYFTCWTSDALGLQANKCLVDQFTDQCSREFLKRDDQILALRLQQEERLDQRKKAAVDRDRARAQDGQEGPYPEAEQDVDEDVPMDDAGNENFGSKTIIIHVGSQNLRIGFATDALPKTIPMVVARKSARSEAEDSEPCPKRLKLDDDVPSEEWFGEEVCLSMMLVRTSLTSIQVLERVR